MSKKATIEDFNAMNCWKCGAFLPGEERKISFRALCDHCGAALHCCKNCKFYAPGRANDCAVPGTEYVADRMASNFCEEFNLLGKPPDKPPPNLKKNFNDLFK